MSAKKGSKVRVEYVGKLSDGSVFDQSKEGAPLEFVMGEGRLIPGFEQAVEGMTCGDQKTVQIPADQAYGLRDESLVRKFGKESLPENFAPAMGMVIRLSLPNGGAIPATIIGITDRDVVVDVNHPLAGKDLTFDIKVVGIDE